MPEESNPVLSPARARVLARVLREPKDEAARESQPPHMCSPEGNRDSEAVVAIEDSPAEVAKCGHSPRTSFLAASDTAASGSRPHSSRNSRRTSRSYIGKRSCHLSETVQCLSPCTGLGSGTGMNHRQLRRQKGRPVAAVDPMRPRMCSRSGTPCSEAVDQSCPE